MNTTGKDSSAPADEGWAEVPACNRDVLEELVSGLLATGLGHLLNPSSAG